MTKHNKRVKTRRKKRKMKKVVAYERHKIYKKRLENSSEKKQMRTFKTTLVWCRLSGVQLCAWVTLCLLERVLEGHFFYNVFSIHHRKTRTTLKT